MIGFIFIKEFMNISILGNILFGAIMVVLTVITFVGFKLCVNGYRDFRDGMKVTGAVITVVSFVLLCSFCVFISSENLISYADSFGLAESTGKYEVTVTAEVDMGEFQERYEILDYENGVYTIKLKENSYERSYIY